jgi:hypothetical protein
MQNFIAVVSERNDETPSSGRILLAEPRKQ